MASTERDAVERTGSAAQAQAGALCLLAERCGDSPHDSETVLAAIRETAEDLLGGRTACLRYLPQTRELVPAGSLATTDGALAEPRPVLVDDWPALAEALEQRRVAQAPHPPAPILIRRPVAAPLLAGGECVAVLLAETRGDEPLTATESAFLHALGAIGGALLASALEQERIRRLSDLKDQFVALAAHELRAPFAIMHGIITTLDHDADLPEAQAEALNRALVEQSDRTSRLVDQLLDLSRLDANLIPIERSRFPIRSRIEGLVRLVAGDRADEVLIQVPGDLEVVADPAAFDRIVSNLVVNAIRHGHSPVTVAARQRDTHFRLTVEDRGRGVDNAFVPKLFDRFARSAGSSEGKGSGLGLSIAQSYAQAHGGELVYSHADPHGARFELVLPRPSQDAERSAANTSPA